MANVREVMDDMEAFAVKLDCLSGALMLAENAAGSSSGEDNEHAFGHFRHYVDSLRVEMDMIIGGISLIKKEAPA